MMRVFNCVAILMALSVVLVPWADAGDLSPEYLYGRWVIDEQNCPSALEISAHSEDGEIMGVRHRELPIEGVQFHPESILTTHGHQLLKNFLAMEAGS